MGVISNHAWELFAYDYFESKVWKLFRGRNFSSGMQQLRLQLHQITTESLLRETRHNKTPPIKVFMSFIRIL